MSVSLDNSEDMAISPNYHMSDWGEINLTLNSSEEDWEKAINIFHDRINGRFLAQIDALQNHECPKIKEFSGFAIVALDCLLIETLGQFYKGIEQTSRKSSEQHFIEFFLGSDHFKSEFDEEKCKIFYKHFRCGILHQAQTKEKSRIRFGLEKMVDYADSTDPKQGLVIDRVKLHDALFAEISDYESLLKAPATAADRQKRECFIRKWSYIVPLK